MLWQIGRYSVLIGCIGSLWGLFMIIVLCLPQAYPYTTNNFNYSPHMLGSILIYALLSWFYSARRWFKCTIVNQELMGEISSGSVVEQSSVDEYSSLLHCISFVDNEHPINRIIGRSKLETRTISFTIE